VSSKINAFALIAFWLVVPGVMVAFSRMVPRKAVIVVLFVTTLFLPELLKFDFPLFPSLDKETLPMLLMAIGVFALAKKDLKAAKFGTGYDFLLLLSVLSVVGTVLTNGDSLKFGPKIIKGQTMYDALSFALDNVLHVALPFFLGRVLFRHASDSKEILKAFVVGALVYLPLILIELKMSPQLHTWIYGYRQHAWGQTKRGDAWRPQVFMEHGLALAIYVCMAVMSSAALARAKERAVKWASPGALVIVLTVLLALLNSVGALVYGVVCLPLLWFLKPKALLRVCAVLAVIIFAYPWLRATEIFPAQEIVDYIAESSPLRAQSLGWRFMNEDQVLERALARPFFGWGGYARGHIWTEKGKNITTIDGAWIALVSRGGFVEFAVFFAILLFPVFAALRCIDKVPKKNQPLMAGLGLMVTVSALDLLPNGLYNSFPLFIAGALAGLVRGMPGETAKGLLDGAFAKRLEAVLRQAGYLPAEGPQEPQRAALTGRAGSR
jgi:hypothetical protein